MSKNVNINIKANSKDAQNRIKKVSGSLYNLAKTGKNNPVIKVNREQLPNIRGLLNIYRYIELMSGK